QVGPVRQDLDADHAAAGSAPGGGGGDQDDRGGDGHAGPDPAGSGGSSGHGTDGGGETGDRRHGTLLTRPSCARFIPLPCLGYSSGFALVFRAPLPGLEAGRVVRPEHDRLEETVADGAVVELEAGRRVAQSPHGLAALLGGEIPVAPLHLERALIPAVAPVLV